MPDDDKVVPFQRPASGDEDERVFKIPGDLDVIKKRLLDPKTRPRDVDALIQFIGRSLLPLIMEGAHYTKEHTNAIYELWEAVDMAAGEGTQFSAADAPIFDFVLTYALENAKAALASPEVTHGSDAHKKFLEIQEKAQYCLKVLEDGVIDEDEPEGEETEPDGAG